MSDKYSDMISFDGSFLEGGGQIIRNAISLSVILGKPVRIYNIRAGRSKPGLMAQHLSGLNLISEMCNAEVDGNYIGSTQVQFYPHNCIQPNSYSIDTKTAGSIALILQLIVPPLIFNGCSGTTIIDMRGGTNVAFAPQIETLNMTLFPLLNKFIADYQLDYKLDMKLRGCYPQGGGRVIFKLSHPLPSFPVKPIILIEKGNVSYANVLAWACGNAPFSIAKRVANSIDPELRQFGVNPKTEVVHEPPSGSHSSSIGVIVSIQTDTGCILSTDYLLKKGEQIDNIGYRLMNDINQHEVCVDSHTQDQLIIFMALAGGKSAIKCRHPLTKHTMTAIHVVEKLCSVKFEQTEPDSDQTCVLSCNGIGWTPDFTKYI